MRVRWFSATAVMALLSLTFCSAVDREEAAVATNTVPSTLPVLSLVEETLGVEDMVQSQLSMTVNPSCHQEACSPLVNTSYSLVNLTITDEPAQSYEHHWLWSYVDSPALQVALTKPGDRARVNWNGLLGFGDLDECVGYQAYPDYSAAIMIDSLIEFDDVRNTGNLSDAKPEHVIRYPMRHFNWTRTLLENNTARAAMGFIGKNYNGTNGNITGVLNFTMSAYAIEGFGLWLPHLSHSPATNQVDLQLDHLKTDSGFKRSRFALELVLVSNAQKTTRLSRQNTRTLDDEHTPGIFKTQELVIPGYNSSLESYLQWRPVVYSTPARDLSASTDVDVGRVVHDEDDDPETRSRRLNNTILYAFYGVDLQDMMVARLNVTFGTAGDGFYKKTKYHAWTFTLGTGRPIHNGMSPMVLLAMTCMLGLLAIVLITACIICGVKRCRGRGQDVESYRRI